MGVPCPKIFKYYLHWALLDPSGKGLGFRVLQARLRDSMGRASTGVVLGWRSMGHGNPSKTVLTASEGCTGKCIVIWV